MMPGTSEQCSRFCYSPLYLFPLDIIASLYSRIFPTLDVEVSFFMFDVYSGSSYLFKYVKAEKH